MTRTRCGWILLLVAGCGEGDAENAEASTTPSPKQADGGQSDEGVCVEGDTRVCVGPAACAGGQACESGAWTKCDCGDVSSEADPPAEGPEPATGAAGSTGDAGYASTDGGSDEPRSSLDLLEVPLVPDSNGWIDASTNKAGIQGAWRFWGGDCLASSTTVLSEPSETFYGAVVPDEDGTICIGGVWASSCPDRGANLSLGLNEGPLGEVFPYNADESGLVGFRFEFFRSGSGFIGGADSPRVTLAVTDSQASRSSWVLRPIPPAGTALTVSWEAEYSDVEPAFLGSFSTQALTDFWFPFSPRATEGEPFQLCVRNLRALLLPR